ncbi:hypothetical protein H9P43_000089 [Blastocladiella emersonii ATCC 22665]|nr:hypothetical protein H9P43_000089 [Blastocladiella emersonii ATCC 22665]
MASLEHLLDSTRAEATAAAAGPPAPLPSPLLAPLAAGALVKLPGTLGSRTNLCKIPEDPQTSPALRPSPPPPPPPPLPPSILSPHAIFPPSSILRSARHDHHAHRSGSANGAAGHPSAPSSPPQGAVNRVKRHARKLSWDLHRRARTAGDASETEPPAWQPSGSGSLAPLTPPPGPTPALAIAETTAAASGTLPPLPPSPPPPPPPPPPPVFSANDDRPHTPTVTPGGWLLNKLSPRRPTSLYGGGSGALRSHHGTAGGNGNDSASVASNISDGAAAQFAGLLSNPAASLPGLHMLFGPSSKAGSPPSSPTRKRFPGVDSDDFDWLHDGSDDEDRDRDRDRDGSPTSATPSATAAAPDDSKLASCHATGLSGLWHRMPVWAHKLTIASALMFLFAIPAIVAGARSPGVLDSAEQAMRSELVLWTVFLEVSLVGYHVLYVTSKAILTSAKMNASLRGLAVVFHIEQLASWMALAFATLATFVAEATILHPRMCDAAALGITAWSTAEPYVAVPVRATNGTTPVATTTTTTTTTTSPTTTTSTTTTACAWSGWWLQPTLGSLFVTSILFLVEKVVLQRIAIAFHRKQYADRLRKAKFSERVLEILTQARKSRKKRAMVHSKTYDLGTTPATLADIATTVDTSLHGGARGARRGSGWRWSIGGGTSGGGAGSASGAGSPSGHVHRSASSPERALPGSAPMSVVADPLPAEPRASGQAILVPGDELAPRRAQSVSTANTGARCADVAGSGDEMDSMVPLTGKSMAAGGYVAISMESVTPAAAASAPAEQAKDSVDAPLPDAANEAAAAVAASAAAASATLVGFDPAAVKPRMVRIGVNNKNDARKLARGLFLFLCPVGRNTLVLEDLKPYIPSEQDCKEFFDLFDKNSDKEISKREFRDVIVSIFKERRNLSESLGHLEMIVGRLNAICMGICCFISIFVWLLFFQVNASNILVSFTSVMVTGTFIFGNTARGAFESLILMFVIHPFDIGDRIAIEGEMFTVDYMGITYSQLRKGDGQEVYYPNSLLMSKVVSNVRRAGDQSDTIQIDVPFASFGLEHYAALRSAIGEYLKRETADWTGRFQVMPQELVEHGHRLRLSIYAISRGNFMDGTKRWARKARLLFFIRDTLMALGVPFIQPTLPVEVRAAPGSASAASLATLVQQQQHPHSHSQSDHGHALGQHQMQSQSQQLQPPLASRLGPATAALAGVLGLAPIQASPPGSSTGQAPGVVVHPPPASSART